LAKQFPFFGDDRGVVLLSRSWGGSAPDDGGFEFLAECACELGVLRDEVRSFREIVREVVELVLRERGLEGFFFVGFGPATRAGRKKEFVLILTDCEMPIDGVADQGGAGRGVSVVVEMREEADAVFGGMGREWGVEKIGDGRHEIGLAEKLLAVRSCGNGAGP